MRHSFVIGLRMFLPPSCMLGNHAVAFSATPVELMVSGWGDGRGWRREGDGWCG